MKKINRLTAPKLLPDSKCHVLMLAFMLLMILSTSAQKKRQQVNPTDVVIEGVVLDSNIAAMPGGQTEVSIMVSKYPFCTILMERTENWTDTLKVTSGQSFKFVVPALAGRLYFSLKYTSEKMGDYEFQQRFDYVYILEKGDRIKCTLSDKTFKFSGKGAAKLNCQTEMYKVKMREDEAAVKILQGNDWHKKYEVLNRLLDSVFQVRKKIISNYSQQMGEDMTRIMLANNIGLKYFETMRQARTMASEPQRYQGYLDSKSYTNFEQDSYIAIADDLLAAAPIYTNILFEKIMTQTRITVDGIIEQNFSERHMKSVFEVIKSRPAGIIRSSLIGLFFSQWMDQPSIYDFVEEGLKVTQGDVYKKIVLKIKAKQSEHRAFYPFRLEDANGKIVTLDDLMNKVVIVDFWFTGCSGCIALKKNMEGVWNTYKDNPKVSFVSIAIDKDKTQWKKSILTREYTEPEAINLHTGGLGKSHPMIKALKITSYPKMYLLKGGKITGNIPYPSGADTTKGTTKEFNDLIDKLLN
ncbi:TlpA family protein disulfide reductase [Pedobacter sp. ISL-68]|uniref:TlpA family protein disulfide reductase n=1 Tax=unclassified Pedobacter TaxID=2628915 RepID=UPI001BEAE80F|nr:MULTISPECIES: TlpA disulfide reductase family protein [unclassified Pedobacter]MBT2561708.1 TlpA family protein disulfide reductase [Pedobacter sp. ISL-64]MBT2591096.1 TlpA family protein disulfide reductase [Pedobacter sp. ISL-68]